MSKCTLVLAMFQGQHAGKTLIADVLNVYHVNVTLTSVNDCITDLETLRDRKPDDFWQNF